MELVLIEQKGIVRGALRFLGLDFLQSSPKFWDFCGATVAVVHLYVVDRPSTHAPSIHHRFKHHTQFYRHIYVTPSFYLFIEFLLSRPFHIFPVYLCLSIHGEIHAFAPAADRVVVAEYIVFTCFRLAHAIYEHDLDVLRCHSAVIRDRSVLRMTVTLTSYFI